VGVLYPHEAPLVRREGETRRDVPPALQRRSREELLPQQAEVGPHVAPVPSPPVQCDPTQPWIPPLVSAHPALFREAPSPVPFGNAWSFRSASSDPRATRSLFSFRPSSASIRSNCSGELVFSRRWTSWSPPVVLPALSFTTKISWEGSPYTS
jgi:hypothetical protein